MKCYFLLTTTLFLFCFTNIRAVDVDPVWSGTINGNCITIGNTNTRLKNNIIPTSRELEFIEIENITEGIPSNYAESVTNISSAPFCIPASSGCDTTEIEFVYLSWGGRSKDKNSVNDIQIFLGKDGVFLNGSAANITSEKSSFPLIAGSDKDGYYSCHADITSYFKNLISNSTFTLGDVYDFYVKDIKTELIPFETEGLFSGWTLNIVYKKCLDPKRSIMVYSPDAAGESNANGGSTDGLPIRYSFGDADPYNISDTIVFCFAGFGGHYSIDDDLIIINKENKSSFNATEERSADKIKFLPNNDDLNPFGSSIFYKQNTCDITHESKYTRGFDMHVANIPPGDFKYISKGGDSFGIYIKKTNENHFITNTVIMIGAPDIPEANISMVPQSNTNITPGETFTVDIYVAVGENNEGLNNIKVVVPISEYIESLESIKITPITEVSSSTASGSVKISTPGFSAESQYLYYLRSNPTYYGDRFSENVKTKVVNPYLTKNSLENEQYLLNGPSSYMINSEITIDFPNLTIPSSVKNRDDVIKITLTLKTKEADDPIYNKDAYLNKKATLIPQAEMSLKTASSNATSIFESGNKYNNDWTCYRCKYACKNASSDMCDGGGGGNGSGYGGGNGGGYGGGGGGSCGILTENSISGNNGLHKRNDEKLIEITINATSDCSTAPQVLPDTISLAFCETYENTVSALDLLIKDAYNFDIDKVALQDSLLWERIKRDSVLAFSQRHGVNRAMMEKLLGTSKNPISIYGTNGSHHNELYNFLDCHNPADLALMVDSIDSIINMRIDVSKLLVLFDDKDRGALFDGFSSSFSITDVAHHDQMIHVEESKTGYIFFDSPWFSSARNTSCDSFIVVKFIKTEIEPPTVLYEKEDLAFGDTIFLCNGVVLPPVEVIKTTTPNLWYVVHAKAEDEDGNIVENDITIDRTASQRFEWDLSLLRNIDTSISGVTKISLYQESVDCKSENFDFYISISDIKDDFSPKTDDLIKTHCQSLSSADSISLKIEKTDDDMIVNWYFMENANSYSLIGKNHEINIRQDSAGVFAYAVSLEKNKCESKREQFYITINPKAKPIAPVTIQMCQGYELTENNIKAKVSARETTDVIYWYKYLSNPNYTESENIEMSIVEDPVSLSDLLSEVNSEYEDPDSCNDKFMVAQPKTKNGCFGEATLITIKPWCYKNDAPTFKGNIDSVLYCLNDVPNELNYFLDDKSGNYNDKWFWYNSSTSSNNIPKYTFGSKFNSTITFPQNTASLSRKEYFVARVDSNGCVSKPDTFTVIVDNSIKDFPMVGDTTKMILQGRTEPLFLDYCKGEDLFTVLPTKSYPSPDYELEWYMKDDSISDCDIMPTKKAKRNNVLMNFQSVGSTAYCVRQSTKLGCKGPWLNVEITINDSIREKPVINPITICQGESISIPDSIFNPYPHLIMEYYNNDKDSISRNDLKIDTNIAGVFKNIFYVSLKDPNNECEGVLVGIDVTINKKPGLPEVGKTDLYFCEDASLIDLVEKSGAKINPADIDTKLIWEPSSTLAANREMNNLSYFVYQQDTLSNCVGDKVEMKVSVEKTFNYKQIDTIRLCSNTTFGLENLVKKSITNTSAILPQTKIGYSIQKLNGTTPGASVSGTIASSKSAYQTDVQRFYIQIKDTVNGCFATDTATIIFQSLPVIQPIADIVVCQFTDTVLPTPVNPAYNFEWKRADGSRISDPQHFQLEISETIRLVAVTNDTLLCADSVFVKMDIKQNPLAANVQNDTVCQFTGNVDLKYAINPAGATDFRVRWFDESGNELLQNILNTNIDFATPTLIRKFTARQENIYTGCFKDTTISIVIKKAYTLNMPDINPVCQPTTVDLKGDVNHYLNTIGVQGVAVEYFKLGESAPISGENIKYTNGRDSVQYIYKIDGGVCQSADTVWVVINQKPYVPQIANGVDTVYFCADNAPLFLLAKNTNFDLINTQILWNGTTIGDSLQLATGIVQQKISAISVNKNSGCESDAAEVVAVIAAPIKVSPLATLEYCAGETVNLDSIARKSFIVDEKHLSNINLITKKNGNTVTNIKALSATVQDTSTYVFTLTDELTGCTASNSATIIFHALPTLQIAGNTTICQTEILNLQATGDDRSINYTWKYDLSGGYISTEKTVAISELQHDTTLYLTGKLAVLDRCESTVLQHITVNPQPEKLRDTTFYFCQDTLGLDQTITLSKTAIHYLLQWYDENKNVLGNPSANNTVSIKESKTMTFFVKQINQNTLCESEFAKINVTVKPQINVTLNDPAPICAPETFDLTSFAFGTAAANGQNPQPYQYIYLGDNSEVTAPASISHSGQYRINYAYTDAIRCSASGVVFITINPKPAQPALSKRFYPFCQTGNDETISLSQIAGDYTFVWKKEGSATTIASNNYTVSTTLPTAQTLIVWRRDTLTGCESDTVQLHYQVLDSIKHQAIADIEICDGQEVDLENIANETFRSGNALMFTFFNITGGQSVSITNVNTIMQAGDYLIRAKDVYSGCEAQESVRVITNTPPQISINGKTVLCANEKLELTVVSTDAVQPAFTWYDNKKTEILRNANTLQRNIVLANKDQSQKDTFYVKSVDLKGCETEQLIEVLTNPIPQRLQDSTVIFCQDNTTKTISVLYDSKYTLLINDLAQSQIHVPIDSVHAPSFIIRQKNELTGCVSEPALVQVTVAPAVQFQLPVIDLLCAPATIDLKTLAHNSISAGTAPFTITDAKNGNLTLVDLNYLNQVDSSGTYTLTITDKYGCTSTSEVQVNIFAQLNIPEALDLSFCQNSGNQLLTASPTGANNLLQWADETGVFTDSIFVSTENTVSKKTYYVRHKNSLNSCVSEKQTARVSVHPAIRPALADTVLCFGSSLDLKAMAAANIKGGTNPIPNTYASIPAVIFSPQNIVANGTFVVTYIDDSGVCTASDTLNVSFDSEISLAISGNTTICAGDTLRLKADETDTYSWSFENTTVHANELVFPTTLAVYNPVGLERNEVVSLKASRLIDPVRNLTCSNSKDISVTIKRVPELIAGRMDTSFCQNTTAQPLVLTPTQTDAHIEWQDINGILVPNTQTAGDAAYQFRQSLNGCYTAWQDYTVMIQEAITEKMTLRDTVYCINETAMPLSSIAVPTGYTVKWYDSSNTELSNLLPSTTTAGTEHFYARLNKGVCTGEIAEITIYTQSRPEKPQVDSDIILCQNSGDQTLQARSSDAHAQFSWYANNIDNQLTTPIVMTDKAALGEKSYFVAQSTLRGCESERAEVKIRIVESPASHNLRIDTCANSHLTIAEVARINRINETIDTLWHGANRDLRIALQSNIGNTAGIYHFSVSDENNCHAIHRLEVFAHKPENILLRNTPSIYCYGDSARFEVSADNAREYIWENITTGSTTYGTVYHQPILEATDFMVIISENVHECKDTLHFSAATYPQTQIKISGDSTICVGSNAILALRTPLTDIMWTMPDLTTRTGSEITFAPEQTERITVSGQDINNCPATKQILITVAPIPDPQIGIRKLIASESYHINRDTAEIYFHETALPEYYESPYTYYWNFGNGQTMTSENNDPIWYEYEDRHVRLIKNFNVTLTVAHAFGCEGSTTASITVDPDFHVPNTYAQSEGVFMEKYELEIFDRVGNLIHRGEGWDGNYKGKPAFTDTYFYAITYYIDGQKNIKTGFVTLISK